MKTLWKYLTILTLCILLMAGCGKKIEINLSEYVSVSYEGYDTIGTATAEFNYKEFINDYEEEIKLTKEGKAERDTLEKNARKAGFDDSAADMMAVFLNGALDKTENLSNGETITYKWNIDNDKINEYFNCDIDVDDLSFQVSDLSAVTAFDPFANLTVSFSGTAPNGILQLSTPICDVCDQIYFEADKEENLSNGDIIRVSVFDSYTGANGADITESVIANSGMLPTVFEKEYTVEGLPKYVLSESDISPETLDKMKGQIEDIIDTYTSKWAEYSNPIGKYYLGMYVQTPKPGVNSKHEAAYTLVYRIDDLIQYKNKWGSIDKIVSTYYPVSFYDITELADGTQSIDLSNYSKPSSSWTYDSGLRDVFFSTITLRFEGYQALDSAFSKIITQQLEDYNFESSVQDTNMNYDGYDSEGNPIE